jgi:predicted nucleic acid-binding Zn ribbon protein
MPLKSLISRIEKCRDNIKLLEEWIDFKSIREQCRQAGLSEFVDKVEKYGLQPGVIENTFFKRFYRLWLDKMIPQFPAVKSFRRRSHQGIINEFVELDNLQMIIARHRIRERLITRLPDTSFATSPTSEIGILKREVRKKRKIKPLRRLFKEIPNLLTALKPCLMMSPLSVSMYLQADGYNFDTVIFDEASQVYTEDAIGAIMRGKQVIIAGDINQLPPTSFFLATTSGEDYDTEDEDDHYDDIGAFDSILDEVANVIPERTLKWHYRSKHEDLIAFSNAKIYNNTLVTFPSNIQKEPDIGVEYIYVENGIYDRRRSRHNVNEAKKVANLVFEHFKKFPNRSLGVVTFSEAQKSAVDNAIDQQIRLYASNSQNVNSMYEHFYSDESDQAFFVKNIERVQGDERDTIIFSIGYAKDVNGVMYMNFGPLSRSGGHRRLNVAITRARHNVKLVGSIQPSDIRLEDKSSEGVKMLRQYIEFAINGDIVLQNDLRLMDLNESGVFFEEAIKEFLVKNGYHVAQNVGCSEYRIDLAVKHPALSDRYVLGIECDGFIYNRARTARERDRLRSDVLMSMAWKLYRIWSVDWIKDSLTEGNKLISVIEDAIENYGIINKAEENDIDGDGLNPDDFVIIDDDFESPSDSDNPYGFSPEKQTRYSSLPRDSRGYLSLEDCIMLLVSEQFPIHYELVCQKLASLLGGKKASDMVRRNVNRGLRNLGSKIVRKNNFLYPAGHSTIKVKAPTTRKINHISIDEIAEAMCVIADKSYGLSRSDLYVTTSRVFGFNRTGRNISAIMESACDFLIDSGKAKEVDEKIIVKAAQAITKISRMRHCLKCGEALARSDDFCGKCGSITPMAGKKAVETQKKCRNCGTNAEAEDTFCGKCGNKI